MTRFWTSWRPWASCNGIRRGQIRRCTGWAGRSLRNSPSPSRPATCGSPKRNPIRSETNASWRMPACCCWDRPKSLRVSTFAQWCNQWQRRRHGVMSTFLFAYFVSWIHPSICWLNDRFQFSKSKLHQLCCSPLTQARHVACVIHPHWGLLPFFEECMKCCNSTVCLGRPLRVTWPRSRRACSSIFAQTLAFICLPQRSFVFFFLRGWCGSRPCLRQRLTQNMRAVRVFIFLLPQEKIKLGADEVAVIGYGWGLWTKGLHRQGLGALWHGDGLCSRRRTSFTCIHSWTLQQQDRDTHCEI